jgi:hypothetical protein
MAVARHALDNWNQGRLQKLHELLEQLLLPQCPLGAWSSWAGKVRKVTNDDNVSWREEEKRRREPELWEMATRSAMSAYVCTLPVACTATPIRASKPFSSANARAKSSSCTTAHNTHTTQHTQEKRKRKRKRGKWHN